MRAVQRAGVVFGTLAMVLALSAAASAGSGPRVRHRSMRMRLPPLGAQIYPVLPDHHGGIWLGPWAHWTDRRWVDAIPAGGLPGADCFNVNGLSAIPGSSQVWAAGWVHRLHARDQTNAVMAIYGQPRSGRTAAAKVQRTAVCVTTAHGLAANDRIASAPYTGDGRVQIDAHASLPKAAK